MVSHTSTAKRSSTVISNLVTSFSAAMDRSSYVTSGLVENLERKEMQTPSLGHHITWRPSGSQDNHTLSHQMCGVRALHY